MRRITLWLLSTVSTLVLLFSYSTSTSSRAATSVLAQASTGTGTGAEPTTGSSGSTGTGATSSGTASSSSAGSGSTSSGSATSGAASSGTAASGATTSAQTYDGSVVSTRYGNVQVQITVEGGKVTKSIVLQVPWSNGKDQQINARAVPILNSEVVQAQSAGIDMVGGATYTSDGYIQSLQAALDAAHLA